MVNVANITNITSLQQMAVYSNNMSGNVLFDGGMFVFFIILLVALLRFNNDFEGSLAISSWTMFIVSALFWMAKVVDVKTVLAFLIIASFTGLYLYSSRR